MFHSTQSFSSGDFATLDYLRLPEGLSPARLDPRHALLRSESLTQALRLHFGPHLAVRVLQQEVQQAYLEENRLLQLPEDQHALVREVILHAKTRDLVFARSVVPLTSLQGELQRLISDKQQPLGDWLFNEPGVSRDSLVPLYTKATPAWASGRRSIVRLNDKPLLIQEVFLPCLEVVPA